MSSTGDERSLSSGIPIPQWLRSKTENYGFDPSTLSPPTHEGDFFYIKFPRPQQPEPPRVQTINEVLEIKEKAFNKHTDSCKQFIPKLQETVQVQKPKILKPMGVDDGFKGEGAACGASVVEVAHQILKGKIKNEKGKSFRPLNRGETEGDLMPSSSYLQQRRDSKSLPVSPITSPESSPLTKRKQKVFGGAFLQNDIFNKSDEDIDKKSGSSWILSSLFSSKEKKEFGKEPINEKSVIAYDQSSKEIVQRREETSDNMNNPINMTIEIKSISATENKVNKKSVFKSKPHLRDLNLMSPSSM